MNVRQVYLRIHSMIPSVNSAVRSYSMQNLPSASPAASPSASPSISPSISTEVSPAGSHAATPEGSPRNSHSYPPSPASVHSAHSMHSPLRVGSTSLSSDGATPPLQFEREWFDVLQDKLRRPLQCCSFCWSFSSASSYLPSIFTRHSRAVEKDIHYHKEVFRYIRQISTRFTRTFRDQDKEQKFLVWYQQETELYVRRFILLSILFLRSRFFVFCFVFFESVRYSYHCHFGDPRHQFWLA